MCLQVQTNSIIPTASLRVVSTGLCSKLYNDFNIITVTDQIRRQSRMEAREPVPLTSMLHHQTYLRTQLKENAKLKLPKGKKPTNQRKEPVSLCSFELKNSCCEENNILSLWLLLCAAYHIILGPMFLY